MPLSEVFFFFSFLLFSFYILVYLELFARKEYRLDRLIAHIEDLGIWALLWPPEFRRPKFAHPRNILIIFFSFSTFLLLLFYASTSTPLAIILFISVQVSSLVIVAFYVFVTSWPVSLYRAFIIHLASKRIAKYAPFVIAVTGSYGKSITKSYIAHILSREFKVIETQKNMNTDIGIALTILRHLHSPKLLFVVEMGAYRSGEITSICRLTSPTIGVITAFGTQHAALFGGVKNIISAKCELALSLPKDGLLLLPDHEKSKIPESLLHKIQAPITTYKHVLSDPSLQAIQASVAVASRLGMTYEEIQNALVTLPKPDNLRVKKSLSRGFDYILSPYSTNPESLISHMALLAKSNKPKKIIVTPGIIELGPAKSAEYKKIIEKTPKNTTIFTTDPYMTALCKKHKLNVTYAKSQKTLFQKVNELLSKDCIILIEGRFRKDFVDTIA